MSSVASLTRIGIVDCWNRIGVRGSSSCPELVRYVHCRNCPVYSEAAEGVLDIDVPDDYVAQSTRHVAGEKTRAPDHTLSVVIFRIGAEWLALPTAVTWQILAPRPIHSLPHRRDGVVLGLANIRGRLLVCVTLRQILQLDNTALQDPSRLLTDARMLVTLQEGFHTVYPVDEVHGVQRFPPEAPMSVSTAATAYVKAVVAWQGRSVGLLDPQLVASTIQRSLASATPI
jgi:chemotaxis-related protein WspD